MLVRNLDFLSSPPQMYILQQKTNKTLFGGILFIIYIIIMLIISFFYILNFALNDKYNIKYSLYKSFENKEEEEYNKNEDLNPLLNFSIDLKKMQFGNKRGGKITEANIFFAITDEKFNFYDKNSIISRTTSNFTVFLVYICFTDCNLEYDKSNYKDLVYYLNISYSGYKINHQNKNLPLERNNDKYTFYKEFYFNFDETTIYDVNWNVIKYKEERGMLHLFDNLLDKKYEFTAIDIDSIEQIRFKDGLEIENEEDPSIKIKFLGAVNMNNNHNQYGEYIRSKKSILDVLADIGALFSTLFSVFSFIFNFYSKNFDNYKIIKELSSNHEIFRATNPKIRRVFNSSSIKFEDIPLSKSNSEFSNDDNTIFNTCKTTPNNSKRISLKEEINFEQNYNNNKSSGIKFIYFMLENICWNKRIKKEYNIIAICNNILSKYTSVETILYNQIIFENLLRDYIWNDDNLNKIGNNYLMKVLKTLIT